jgi:uncharacterized membrane protein
MVMQVQQAIAMSQSRVVSDDNIWNSAKGLVKDMNLGDPREYFTDPSTLPPAEPQPDPHMFKAQSEAQIQSRKQQLAEIQAQAQQMMAAQKMQQDAALQQQQTEATLQAQREKAALEAELGRDKATFEANLAVQTADRNYELAKLKIERDHELKQQAAAQVPQDRPGGALDA